MDFCYVSYNAPVPMPLILLLHLIDHIYYGISAVLFYLGLYPSFETIPPPWDDQAYIALATEFPCPSSALPITSSMIKSRLPVVEYASFVRASHGENPMCAVCLGGLEARDEVRELSNCRHAFHKGCIDEWVDIGKFTCPLCRSQLLPAQGKAERGSLLNLMEILVSWGR